MGESAVAVYVCQYVYVAVVRNERALINTLENVQRDVTYGSGVMAGIYQVRVQVNSRLMHWGFEMLQACMYHQTNPAKSRLRGLRDGLNRDT